MPLTGMPMLSTNAASSAGGMIARIAVLDFGELLGAFLDARADAKAHVHEDLAGVDGRKEVPAEIGHQQEGGAHERQEADDEDRPPPHRQRERSR